MATKKKSDSVVKAVTSFMDAKTGRDYRPGDVVVGWDADRAAHYAEVGLVEVIEPKTEEAPQAKTATRRKPGPSATKPKAGPKETK
jgi:hypothetical protein